MELREVVAVVHGTLQDTSAESLEITRISSLESADEESISFLVKPTLVAAAAESRATAFFVKKGWEIPGKVTVEVDDPYVAYALTAQLFEDAAPRFSKGISSHALISPSVMMGNNVTIGPGAVIGADVVIGDDTIIDANVVVEKRSVIGDACHIHSGVVVCVDTQIGDRVILGPGAVIGSEGFANAFTGKTFIRIPCFGRVVIENDVEIGANTTIDRGNFENTTIKAGARIDNLVMIAHNVVIGESCGIAAQVGFAGSTKLGDRVMVGGQAGFGGHITVGDDVFVGGQSGVQSNIPAKSTLSGAPAVDLMQRRRIDAAELRLPEALKEIKALRKELEELKNQMNGK